MRLLQINSYNHLSTGRIMMDISDLASEKGIVSFTACPAARTMYAYKAKNQIFIGTILERNIHRVFSEYSGYHGLGSIIGTLLFLKKVNKINPDIVHLHNIHGSYINIPLLFRYFKNHPHIRVIWTFHDCWPFTGGCPHFEILNCNKWKNQCGECSYKGYPKGKRDKTRQMFQLKKKLFLSVPNLEIVCPSKWLGRLVKQSYFQDYPVHVINNGIDLNAFKPLKGRFREKYGLMNQYIILGVASSWSFRKGLDRFVNLAKYIPSDISIVLVGVTEDVIYQLPQNILAIYRTSNIEELADIYSSCNVFFNPTREDNFPTVNIEALASGTPVVTFPSGGSPEIIDNSCGLIVDEENYIQVLINHRFADSIAAACRNRALQFAKKDKYLEYIHLYEKVSTKTDQSSEA